MSALTWDQFPAFFEATQGAGRRPFAWQLRLAEHLASTGRWPELVTAPTGAGKSIPVAMHIFGNAVAACGGPRIPRRLVTVVNRRALVDNQHDVALDISEGFRLARPGSLLADVADALRSLATRADADPLQVVQWRGGARPDREWVNDPAACTVIAATPDMWGSGALMRGYGTRRVARPREAGLFAYDTVVAIDETHLNRQLALTARRIRELEEGFDDVIGVPRLQVVELSATPPREPDIAPQSQVGVLDADLDTDAVLRDRLTAPKPVTYVGSPDWPGPGGRVPAKHIARLVDEVSALRRETVETPGVADTVGCIVNRVDTAVAVGDALEKAGLRVAVWVGPMRPHDLARRRHEQPGLFDVSGDDSVDVLVATATVEVGVDIDLAGMVTELASGSAVAQRAGRVNRLGRRRFAPIRVVGPLEGVATAPAPPYSASELDAARSWVVNLSETAEGMAPWSLSSHPAPDAEPRRDTYERLEPGIVDMLAQTSSPQFVDQDLTLWLRDDLSPERDPVWIAPRRFRGLDDAELVSLLTLTPPVDDELYPVRIQNARPFIENILEPGGSGDVRVVMHDPDAGPVLIESADAIRPGSVLFIDSDRRFTRFGVVATGHSAEKPTDVFWGPLPVERPAATSPVGVSFVGDEVDEKGTRWCHDLAGRSSEEAQERFAADHAQWQVALPPPALRPEHGPLPWVVAVPVAAVLEDEERRQEWTRSRTPVTLDVHQRAVGDRAENIAHRLGLSADVAHVLGEAGRHHDDGKSWNRFQRMLYADARGRSAWTPQSEVLAKSLEGSASLQRWIRARYVPPGWRHEQASVVYAAVNHGVDDPLTLRLIGTSHGHGRSEFPFVAEQLHLEDEAATTYAARLFDRREWDALIDATHRRFGFWGCCYLEALLRGADGQVSKEGS